MEKYRIAFFEEWPSLRAQKIMHHLCEKFEITYVTSAKGQLPNANFMNLKVYPAPRYINQRGWQFSRLADRLYQQKQIDFAVCYASITFLTRRVPLVNILGGSYFTDFKLHWQKGSLLRRIKLFQGFAHYTIPEWMGCKRAKKHIVNSRELRACIEDYYGINSNSMDVIYNGIDEDFRNQDVDRKRNLEQQSILLVGRLHESKGVLSFVEALIKRGLDIKVTIAGDGPDFEKLNEIGKNYSNIVLTGHISKEALLREMARTNIFVFPSFHEGCPNALLEAMAAGHACVCYDIPPVREVLGEAGILVPKGRPDMLCDAVQRLITDKKELEDRIVAASRQSNLFSWDICAREVEESLRCFGDTLQPEL